MERNETNISRRVLLGGAAVGALSLTFPALAFGDPTAAEKQAQADAVRVKVVAMQEELSRASQEYYVALDEYDAAIAAKGQAQVHIDEANGKIGACQDKLGSRVRTMYRNGNPTFLDIVLGSATFEEFISNWDILNLMNENDAALVQQTKDLRTEVEAQKEEYLRQELIAGQKTAEAKAIAESVQSTVAALQAELDSLDGEARELLLREQEEAAAAARAAEAAVSGSNGAGSPTGGAGNGGNAGGSNDGGTGTAGGDAGDSGDLGGSTGGDDGGASGGDDGGNNGDAGGDDGGSWTGGSYPSNGSIVAYAEYCLGTPYVWAGNTPGVGLDCSGLTHWCYNQVGIYTPRSTYYMKSAAKWVGSVSEAEPGDILWNYGHVGICVSYGGGTYIHAPQPGDVVKYSTWPQFECALRF